MTTTYELYTNENGTPKAVEGKAPAILERVETLEETLANEVITSAGGQIDGQIVFGAGNPIAGARNDINMLIAGGTGWEGGAHLILNGKDVTNRVKGAVELVASDGANEGRLDVWPNGLLRWNGADVERVLTRGQGFIRYASGLQICWGSVYAPTSSWTTVTFGLPFSSAPFVVAQSTGLNASAGSFTVAIGDITETAVTVQQYRGDTFHNSCAAWWIAIGDVVV